MRTPSRWASARHPLIYEINTWPWLADLRATAGTSVDLSSVPEQYWDTIADAGFDAVWLMGVWERSPGGAAIALQDPDLVETFQAVLPDWSPDDVVGSAYCIRDYVVDAHLGGRDGLAVARSELAARGLALLLDFVPNHVAPDHPWTATHPEYFVMDGAVPAKGKDPYFPAWADVVQLNAFSATLRDAMAQTLCDIAGQCDGVRCDMAMLTINEVFARTWGDRVGAAPDQEYWPTIIGAVRATHPGFGFIAEAYWDTEHALQEQGFDFCYDKKLYDRLMDGDAAGVRAHLSSDPAYQERLVRFAENHDEPRLAAIADPARQRAVAVATLTQTGARLVHHGQLEGRKIHVPVFLGRGPREEIDDDLASFYRSLLMMLHDSSFRSGQWTLCDAVPPLLAWCWEGERRWSVVVNLSDGPAAGRVSAPWGEWGIELGAWGWQFSNVRPDRPSDALPWAP
ncbi:alpha-amylase family glycosyl hydrolase [Mycolicibacterium komossense]|uniref:Alpha-amylase n=1 Tax=Mycolicibacterium komossense TaxID=1779 RepID=A0ABT3C936_9MYCO|nr:alpha-amylase family glycosyl hydrolase [Mycolicibacterium komossense]MCV7225962.1 alpha-amylase [Mycolicibacterium komossense]